MRKLFQWSLVISIGAIVLVRQGVTGQLSSKQAKKSLFQNMDIKRAAEGHIVAIHAPSQTKEKQSPLTRDQLKHRAQSFLDAWISESKESGEAWRIRGLEMSRLGTRVEVEHLYHGLPVWPHHFLHFNMTNEGSLDRLQASNPIWQKPRGSFRLSDEQIIERVLEERQEHKSPDSLLKGIFVEAPSGQGHFAYRVFISGEEWVLNAEDGAVLAYFSRKKHLDLDKKFYSPFPFFKKPPH